MDKNILVTGGAGYIGTHTEVELLNRGYNVIAFDNMANSCEESIRRVEQITGKASSSTTRTCATPPLWTGFSPKTKSTA